LAAQCLLSQVHDYTVSLGAAGTAG
jgi:hypothetical protein